MKYLTIEDTIGNTPLVQLQRLPGQGNASRGNVVLGKLEGNNPAGSVKDRPAYNMIMQAEKRGQIKPGDTLIEATSGNTGIALAMIAQLSGIPGDDFYTYNTGPIFRIKTSVSRQYASYSSEEIVILAPYSKIPVKIWDKRKTYQRIGNTQHNE